ncbi:cytochrome P450 [Pikeienuella piscinae]|uniref:Cytochrome P450 n=1 Tax=Pikeienuella piscinae TaxID=2748098 RepID=A0A7L5BTX3_9RHOB|nr:cytochrome P450 [Pikeienuella piscinae]QIE54323.1 cytochrome P450 [Pikeienuella piscinae]
MNRSEPFRPPAPKPKTMAGAFASAFLGARDVLSLLPGSAYETFIGQAPGSKRPIFIVNHPHLVRKVLIDRVANYPKSDLMVGALAPLVGDGMFISAGETWARQRRMIDPAFAHMRIKTAYQQMVAAVDAAETRLDAAAGPLPLDEEMSRLTADIVFRTIFSEPIEGEHASAVFHAFAEYQNSVPQIEPKVMLESPAWAEIEPPKRVKEMCAVIRERLGVMIDRRLASGERRADIAGDVITARDPETGEGFTRDELIDQIAVFFLAGHETSASALTWAFFILSQTPETVARIRKETARAVGDGPIRFEHVRALGYTRNVFREALRLYPPVSFITRIATKDDVLGEQKIAAGSLVVVSPWLIHRHRKFWRRPDVFDPDRHLPGRMTKIASLAYLPFGLGPRVCAGASFATTESVLILASLCRRYDFETLNAKRVMPVGKLTTRPKEPIRMRFLRRAPHPASAAAPAPVSG